MVFGGKGYDGSFWEVVEDGRVRLYSSWARILGFWLLWSPFVWLWSCFWFQLYDFLSGFLFVLFCSPEVHSHPLPGPRSHHPAVAMEHCHLPCTAWHLQHSWVLTQRTSHSTDENLSIICLYPTHPWWH